MCVTSEDRFAAASFALEEDARVIGAGVAFELCEGVAHRGGAGVEQEAWSADV